MRKRKKNRSRETQRKRERKAQMLPVLRMLKQLDYMRRTGRWEYDYERLHWHHLDPDEKYRKIAHLASRSPETIVRELAKCVAVHEREHREIHGVSCFARDDNGKCMVIKRDNDGTAWGLSEKLMALDLLRRSVESLTIARGSPRCPIGEKMRLWWLCMQLRLDIKKLEREVAHEG